MGVYDTKLIYSWTPREFKNFIKASQLRQVDDYEMAAVNAYFTVVAKSKKRLKLSDIYDAEKHRKQIINGTVEEKPRFNAEMFRNAQEAMKKYRPNPTKKGG